MKAQVLAPIAITDAMYTASSVAEPDTATGEAIWVAATVYAIGDEVIRTGTHRVYTALAAGADPGLPEATPTRWRNTRPTNKWAAFDLYRSTAIRENGTLTMTVKPGIITGMQFFGLVGDSIQVVIKNATSLVTYYDQTTSLSLYLSGDLEWEFWFGTPRQQDALRITGLYPDDAQVEITLTASVVTGWAEIGILALGSFNDLGLPVKGFTASPVDYSIINVDPDTGEVSIEPGLAARNIKGRCVMLTAAEAQAVADVVYMLLGVPAAYVITTEAGYDYLSAFGLGSADITADDLISLSLDVRGII